MLKIQRYRGVDIKLDKGRWSIIGQGGQVITRYDIENIHKLIDVFIDAEEAAINAEITRMKEERYGPY